MVLKYVISPYPSLLEDMVAKVYEASDQLAEIDSVPIPQPHNAPVTVTFNGLDKVVHVVRLFTASGAKLHEYNAEPVSDLITVFDPIRFVIGDGGVLTPGVGTDSYHNDALIGLGPMDYLIYRRGVDFLTNGVDVNYLQDVGGNYTGTFQLVAPDQFQDKESFTIIRQPKVTTANVNDSVVGKWISGVVDVGASRSYLATDLRKLIRFTATCAYTFSGAIPIGYGFLFNNYSSPANAVGTINFSNAPLRWDNTTKPSITLPKYTEACFIFDGTVWNVVYLSNTSWVNSSSPQTPGQNIGVGEVLLGNVPVGDFAIDVTHNFAIVGNYYVFPSCRGAAATLGKDDDLQLAWHHHATDQANKFRLGYGIPNGSIGHNITVCFLIVKAP